jgi:hypothetical protein
MEAAMSARALVLVVAALPLAACQKTQHRPLPPSEAKKLLIDRNWIDTLPRERNDKIHVFRFVPSMGGGVYQDRTIFFGTFELFGFGQDGREIEFVMLHTGQQMTAKFTIEPTEPEGPGATDLRLTLDPSPRGPAVYHGWRNEGRDLDAHLQALLHN